MQAFKKFNSSVIPLNLNDVDTDLIIPAQYLTSVSREGYGQNLFKRLKESDPKFPMNLAQHKDSKILLSARNFGCGSSREAAVWALQGAGIKVVIAESFADIFSSNSAKNGLLLIALPEDTIRELIKAAEEKLLNLEIDLESQTVSDAISSWCFKYDAFRKHCLLQGLDDLDYILSNRDKISEHKTQNRIYLRVS